MTYSFRRGVRESVGLWINLVAGTGGGKTFTGMRLASGIAGDKPFALIDTENRRALHYADQFKFDHADLRAPFRPDAYADAIVAADAAGYPVIMVDSGSHVWAGEGGVLDWQEEELERMAGADYGKRERVKMAAWIKPKTSHKKMVQKLLQIKAHLILCLRAEEKIEMVKKDGKLEIQKKQSLTGKDGWIPICDKNLPFEATCSFLLLASNPGVPHPIKLQEQHKDLFPLDKPITEESGRRLAEWAKGSAATPQGLATSSSHPAGAAGFISYEQVGELERLFAGCDKNAQAAFLKAAGIASIEKLSVDDYQECRDWIDRRAARRQVERAQETAI